MRNPKIVLQRMQTGVTLLEVLITILVLSFGLLGVAGLTATSLQMTKTSQYQSTALQLAVNYAERMRGNTAGVTQGDYDKKDVYQDTRLLETIPSCASSTLCTATELAAIDKAEWVNNLRQLLPGGDGFAVYNDSGTSSDKLTVDLWILWQEPGMDLGGGDTLSVAGTGGNPCPSGALTGYAGDQPVCSYYRFSL